MRLKRKADTDEVFFDEDNSTEQEVKDTLKEAVPVEKKEEIKEVKKMVVPKYDTKTGLFTNLEGIEDAELKAVLKLANDTVKANANSALIAKAIDTKLGSIKLADGISSDVILAVLDRTNIKVTDGKVSGVDEAFEALQKSNTGLFKPDGKEDISSPILEGFNPVQNNLGRTPNSFAEAIAMENGNV